ncbi:hypothetical protein DICPUDRAFT_91491 [Dictyostelium purpureum]|uniref:GOST seven transmembrane domain-containing protein n=1 Tax=Dictyostelium purpureum TaxID=5786 RepID=F0ZD93_DICPU|nr:uncharacterized protein DICPUDRAFT_91491 [Dictyostelium purpureum]EGC38067.1 hypothetical protein DICPUDRAFT_91491 [Dictyostelium purpureum]|eukprot:XP_003285374.1 hypothetical protein DICPUDRAFT_91491 [Dictyostelium purpureum]
MVKVYMFRKFIWVLLLSAVASFIILTCQIFVNSTKSFDYGIQTGWIIDVVWGASYFTVLVAICWIWKPNSNNQKFAYSELNDQDEEVVMESIDSYGNISRNRNSNDIESNITQHDNVIEEIDDDEMQNAFSIQDNDDDTDEVRRNKEKTDIADMFSKL